MGRGDESLTVLIIQQDFFVTIKALAFLFFQLVEECFNQGVDLTAKHM